MRVFAREVLLAILTLCVTAALAQKPPATSAHRSLATWKQYCHPQMGYCFKYPDSWELLGEVFDGNGIVVAPSQQGDREGWDSVTAGLIVPPPKDDADTLGLDQMIVQTMASLRDSGQNLETLQRQERTIDGSPAQMLKVRYHGKTDNRDWIEQLVFITGPDDEIYSVALKCAPGSLTKLEPVWAGILQSWKLPPPPQPPAPTDSPK